jgi:hypothetical protein
MPKDKKHDFAVSFCGTLMVDQSDRNVDGKNFPCSWHFWYGL